MLMKIIGFTSLFTLIAGAAVAQEGSDGFATVDTDASGTISLEEVQSLKPDVTADDFTTYDFNGSGDLSQDEFVNWVAAINNLAEQN